MFPFCKKRESALLFLVVISVLIVEILYSWSSKQISLVCFLSYMCFTDTWMSCDLTLTDQAQDNVVLLWHILSNLKFLLTWDKDLRMSKQNFFFLNVMAMQSVLIRQHFLNTALQTVGFIQTY